MRALPPDTTPSTDIAGLPTGFGAAFALADQRARRIVYAQQCAAVIPSLRARGKFGAAASAPRLPFCARTADGIPLGGVYDYDVATQRVRRLIVIRLDGAQPRWTQPLDTAALAVRTRLERDVAQQATQQRRGRNRPFTAVAITLDDGTPEVWLMPVAAGRAVVLGGDVGATTAPTAAWSTIADRLASWRTMPIPTTGVVTVRSSEPRVAAVQELVVARQLAERGREVTVVTAVATSALVPGQDASGSRFTWQHTPTK